MDVMMGGMFAERVPSGLQFPTAGSYMRKVSVMLQLEL